MYAAILRTRPPASVGSGWWTTRRPAEEEVIAHEDRRRLALRVVPVLEPGIDFLTLQFGQLAAVQLFQSELYASSWGKEQEVGEDHAEPGKQQLCQRRLFAGRSEAEHAAPEPRGAHEHDIRLRHRSQDFGHRSRTADRFHAAALDPAGRPQDEVLALLQAVDDGIDRRLRFLLRLGAGVRIQVGHPQRVEQFRERPQK